MTEYPVQMDVIPEVVSFFDDATNTISHVVKDPGSPGCAVIDSVMDIDYAAGRITYDHADRMIDLITARGWRLEWIIETHVHADHLSAAWARPLAGNVVGHARRRDRLEPGDPGPVVSGAVFLLAMIGGMVIAPALRRRLDSAASALNGAKSEFGA